MRVRNLWSLPEYETPQVWRHLSIKSGYDLFDIETGIAAAQTPCLEGHVYTAQAGKSICEMFGDRAVFTDDGRGKRVVKIGCLDEGILYRLKSAIMACDDIVTIRVILWAIDPTVFSEYEPKVIRNVRTGVATTQEPKASNVVRLPTPDLDKLLAAMTGPERGGNHVVIDGRLVPSLAMRDTGDEIEFVLDSRLMFRFPRDVAWLAASFAFHAMAIGAGFGGPGGLHASAQHYGVPVEPVVVEEGK